MTRPPEVLFVIANHQPASTILKRELRALPKRQRADYYVATVTYAGYALFADNLKTIDQVIDGVPESDLSDLHGISVLAVPRRESETWLRYTIHRGGARDRRHVHRGRCPTTAPESCSTSGMPLVAPRWWRLPKRHPPASNRGTARRRHPARDSRALSARPSVALHRGDQSSPIRILITTDWRITRTRRSRSTEATARSRSLRWAECSSLTPLCRRTCARLPTDEPVRFGAFCGDRDPR